MKRLIAETSFCLQNMDNYYDLHAEKIMLVESSTSNGWFLGIEYAFHDTKNAKMSIMVIYFYKSKK